MTEPVTQGIYRYSRHPIYVAIVLIYLSVGIASVSWVFICVSVIWSVLICISAVGEEHYCLEKFGLAYREYMNRTPRWIGIPKS
jgi:protein-S-isoprenylcysteine O-methyltransferase Ste14